jgi:ABC-2 type transport system ATP-binding protein
MAGRVWLTLGVLNVDGVTKRYGDHDALRGVSLNIQAGEVCALLGPNGAGKTTLVSAIAGLRKPDSGTITIDGVPVWPSPKATKAKVGIAPQDLGIYPVVTVAENLRLFGELAGLRGSTLRQSISDTAQLLELDGLMDREGRHLSGGEQRRLHTAMAMLHRPPLLILDEPTTGVDVGTRSRLLEGVRQLAGSTGTAVCYSTHYLAEVTALQASVAIVDRGRLIARGNVDELIRTHGTSAVELTLDDGLVQRHPCNDPATAIASVINGLDESTRSRLRHVNLAAADLESVFVTLTGRRYSEQGEPATDQSGGTA